MNPHRWVWNVMDAKVGMPETMFKAYCQWLPLQLKYVSSTHGKSTSDFFHLDLGSSTLATVQH